MHDWTLGKKYMVLASAARGMRSDLTSFIYLHYVLKYRTFAIKINRYGNHCKQIQGQFKNICR